MRRESMQVRIQVCMSLLVVALTNAELRAQALDFEVQAKVFVNTLANRQFSEAEKSFDETMSKVLPADKLASTWDSVIAQAGEFKAIAGSRQEEFKGYQLVFVSCHFSHSDLDAKVVYDGRGKVAGLFFVPPQVKVPDSSIAKTAK